MTVSNEANKKQIFISHHNSQSKSLADLKTELQAIGFDCFLAHEDIDHGENFVEVIESWLRECDIFLYVGCPKAHASAFCQQEIGFAKALNKEIVCVMIGDQPPSGFLEGIQAIRCNNLEQLHDTILRYLPETPLVKHFRVLNCKGFSKENKPDYIYLSKNLWTDSGFCTIIDIEINGKKFHTKIAYKGQSTGAENHSLHRLPTSFPALGAEYFSRIKHYDATLSPEEEQSLRYLLRDIETLSPDEKRAIQNEPVLKKSLFREDSKGFQAFSSHISEFPDTCV